MINIGMKGKFIIIFHNEKKKFKSSKIPQSRWYLAARYPKICIELY